MLAGLQAVRAGASDERSGLPSRDRRGLMDCGKAESTSARPLNANLKVVSDLMAAVTDAVSNQERGLQPGASAGSGRLADEAQAE